MPYSSIGENNKDAMQKKIPTSQPMCPLLFIIILLFNSSNAIDNAHFYRANYTWQEPRLPNDWLSSAEVSLAGGSTAKGRNASGQTTNILNIYGPESIRDLATNVPLLDPTNPLDAILIALEALPADNTFATLELTGKFSITESTINAYQNLINGFFIQAYLPLRYLKISNIHYNDLSPETGNPNRSNPEWIAFLQNFPAILNRYGIDPLHNSRAAGCGDLSILAGWAGNYVDTYYLDFIDVSAKVGGLFPTGRTQNIHNPFELPLGYNGHYGVPLKFDVSIGLYEWITTGLHIGALFLFENKQTIRMKTSTTQNGFITLTTGDATIDPGTLWDFEVYFTADHFFKGLSLSLGYSFNQKDSDFITPHNQITFNTETVNKDQLFKSWNMQVLHVMAEYDFAKKYEDIGPRICLFYNHVLNGKRIFSTHMIGTYIGIDIAYVY